ncbi:MAG: hypothetical protein WCR30_04505 [Clostridia bacterium]
MKKILTISLFLFLALFTTMETTTAFAYWQYNTGNESVSENSIIQIGDFSFNENNSGCHCIATVIINDAFRIKYMTLKEDGTYDWKRNQYNDIINADEIRALTPVGTIVQSDDCYEIISTYNLIDHGIPSYNRKSCWAYIPIHIDYVSGWSYPENRVVRASDGQYFKARFYTSADPLQSQTGWDKIEPVNDDDFDFYPNTTTPNYAYPKMNQIQRAYNWDFKTTYLTNDIVLFNGIEYIALCESMNQKPINKRWAWQEL